MGVGPNRGLDREDTTMIRSAALALALALCPAIPTSPPVDAPRAVPSPALPPCPGIVVVNDPSWPLGCDVSPPNILVELGMTPEECDQAGGRWHARARLCAELDY